MASLSLKGVAKDFSGIPAVRNIDLDIAEGEFIVLLGPSGCGKTTTLRMIAGFVRPSAGRILIGGEDVTGIPPRLRNIGMVFQNYALFPNMSVAGNIAFGLEQRRTGRKEIAARVAGLLDLVQLAGRGGDRIDELSGGQQQRVALARALAASPRILLMDEPLAALDLKLREAMQRELRRIQRELGITTVLVTHDQNEAMHLADRIVIMGDGAVEQIGLPHELYHAPRSKFVAGFIGKNNLLRGRVVAAPPGECRAELAEGVVVAVSLPGGLPIGTEFDLSIRPEFLTLSGGGTTTADNTIPGIVEQCRFLGNVTHYFVRAPWGGLLLVEASAGADPVEPGARVGIAWRAENAIVFPPVGRVG